MKSAINKEDRRLRFKWCIQALSMGPDIQLGLYPHFTCVADELALEFEECLGLVEEIGFLELLTRPTKEAVEALNQKIDSMSGPAHMEYWCDDGLRTLAAWDEVRELARYVLDCMGWPHERPPATRALYVGPDT